MRGTLIFRRRLVANHRIIPAYAGNTLGTAQARPMPEDHPRICGEHPNQTTPEPDRRGSSPHMRGTLQHDQLHQLITGIIPAYAGNTSVPPPYMASLRDHPRICGEHDYGESYRSLGRGSSPHMRGTHLLRFVGYHRAGIIPAYAGNTLFCSTIAAFTGDHPRICGEHHRRDGEMRHAGGIIPAYAGNTLANTAYTRAYRDHPRICGEHSR